MGFGAGRPSAGGGGGTVDAVARAAAVTAQSTAEAAGAAALSAATGAGVAAAAAAVALAAAQGAAPTKVRAATTGALPASTFNAGAGTLTANANGATPAQDGVTLGIGDVLLVNDQAAALQNGPYTMTQNGTLAGNFAKAVLSFGGSYTPGDLPVDDGFSNGFKCVQADGLTYAALAWRNDGVGQIGSDANGRTFGVNVNVATLGELLDNIVGVINGGGAGWAVYGYTFTAAKVGLTVEITETVAGAGGNQPVVGRGDVGTLEIDGFSGGTGAVPTILTRLPDAPLANGALYYVAEGDTQGGHLFALETLDPITLNTTGLAFRDLTA